jgi:carboxyl-terminal processing protease
MDYGYEDMQEKKSGFGKGLLFGVLIGFAITVIVLIVAVKVYTGTTSRYLVIGGDSVNATSKSDILDSDTIAKRENLMSYVDLYFNDEYDEDAIRESIYAGTLAGLGDKYSVYYTAEEYEELQISTQGNYYGIGAGLTQDQDTMEVTITKVYEGTPAEEAGLKNGDQIVSVDDITATSMELSLLVEKIRGEEGTKVHLEIYRASTEENLTFDVERRQVNLPSVASEMLDDGIGYIEISEFQSDTANQFDEALSALQKDGMKKLIVDVRGNPGGLLTSVVDILDTVLPEGTVVYTEDKYGAKDTYTSDASCIDCPIAVLIDANSASAAEIFAGAIKDYDYGTLIGTTTYGKGIVQSIFPMEDGSALKLTTAKYYTPNGNYIHGVGIDPDIELEYKYTGPDDNTYNKKYDNQLQKAIEVLE